MKEFMMIFRSEYNPGFIPTSEQMTESIKQWQDWIGGIAAQGKFIGTNRLSSSDSKVLKPNNLITDGPYTEIKEIVGGYLIVKSETIEEALKLAEGCPILIVGGNVEVRPIIPMSM
jgi:hypothetical protein